MATAAIELETTGELAQRFNVPRWLVTRVVDELGIVAKRAGQYRLVASCDFPALERELSRRKEKAPTGSGAGEGEIRSRTLARPGGGTERPVQETVRNDSCL